MAEPENDKDFTLSEEFMKDYEKFIDQFDEIAKNLFNGEKAIKLKEDFFEKYANYMKKFPFFVNWSKYPDCSYYDSVAEDKKIINSDLKSNDIGSSDHYNIPKVTTANYAKVLGQVYWRASAAEYFYITLLKSRDNIDLDQVEMVNLSRHAIRHDPNNFKAHFHFMIVVGYQVDRLTNPRERAILGNLFMHSTLRCQRMEPNDALAFSLYGRYLYNIANLNWIERKVASGISGEKMSGSYEEAEKMFLHAHSLKSDWLPTGLWIARCLIAQKRPLNEIKKWIDLSLSYEPFEPTSVIERQECLDLKSKLKLPN